MANKIRNKGAWYNTDGHNYWKVTLNDIVVAQKDDVPDATWWVDAELGFALDNNSDPRVDILKVWDVPQVTNTISEIHFDLDDISEVTDIELSTTHGFEIMPKQIVLQGANEEDPSFNEIGWTSLKTWNLTSSDYEDHKEVGHISYPFTNPIKQASYATNYYYNSNFQNDDYRASFFGSRDLTIPGILTPHNFGTGSTYETLTNSNTTWYCHKDVEIHWRSNATNTRLRIFGLYNNSIYTGNNEYNRLDLGYNTAHYTYCSY